MGHSLGTPQRPQSHSNHGIASPTTPQEEKEQLEQALAASMSSSKTMHSAKAAAAAAGAAADEFLQATLRDSLLELEMLNRQQELEAAELMKAVSLSLEIEEQRIRNLLKAASENTHMRSPINDTKGCSVAPEATSSHLSYLSEAKLGSEDNAATNTSEAVVDSWSIDDRDDEDYVEPVQYKGTAPTSYNAEQGNSYIADSKTNEDDPIAAVRPQKPPKKTKEVGAKGVSTTALAPLKPLKPLRTLGALPPIKRDPTQDLSSAQTEQELEHLAQELADKKREAAAVMRQTDLQLADQRAEEEKLRLQLEKIDPNEAERRAAHMRLQRDKLLAKKKAEREAKVREEEERTSKATDERLSQRPTDFLEQQRLAASGGAANTDSKEDYSFTGFTKEEMEEGRRAAMAMTLARRMKIALVQSSENAASHTGLGAEEQFNDLELKIKQVEALQAKRRAGPTGPTGSGGRTMLLDDF